MMFRRLTCDVQEAYITERPSHVAAYKLLLCCSFVVISIFCCNITHKRSIIVYSISHEPELDIEVHLNDTGIAHYTTACGR